jgi:hypothetical protein
MEKLLVNAANTSEGVVLQLFGISVTYRTHIKARVMWWALHINYITHHNQLLVSILNQNNPVQNIHHRLHKVGTLVI